MTAFDSMHAVQHSTIVTVFVAWLRQCMSPALLMCCAVVCPAGGQRQCTSSEHSVGGSLLLHAGAVSCQHAQQPVH
jgi:hypothetical protein